jgi:hypothetical protein
VREGAIVRNHRGIERLGVMYKVDITDYSMSSEFEGNINKREMGGEEVEDKEKIGREKRRK